MGRVLLVGYYVAWLWEEPTTISTPVSDWHLCQLHGSGRSWGMATSRSCRRTTVPSRQPPGVTATAGKDRPSATRSCKVLDVHDALSNLPQSARGQCLACLSPAAMRVVLRCNCFRPEGAVLTCTARRAHATRGVSVATGNRFYSRRNTCLRNRNRLRCQQPTPPAWPGVL